MSTQMQLRGGTTSENLVFTGAQREVTVDTDQNQMVVHDGITPGGFRQATESQVVDGTNLYSDDIGGGSTANAYILVPNPTTNVPNAYINGSIFTFVTSNPNTGPATASFQGLGVKSIKLAGGADPSPGDVAGRVTLIFDAGNDWLELQKKPAGNPPQLRTIGASVTGSAMTVTLEPTTIDFRSSSASSGVVLTRVVTSQIALTIPAGATLGTQSGVANQIAVIAIDNAGTVELAVINLATITTLNETGLISTAAITAASNSSTTFYSASARLNVPYRVVGLVGSTQAAAGTWATPPSLIQGQGGQAIFGIANRIFMGTSQSTTAGTSIDFTGIPSGINRLTVSFSGVSTTGTSAVMFQLGAAGSVENTGYLGGTTVVLNGSTTTVNYSAGVTVDNATAAASVVHGAITFTRITGNSWAISGNASLSNAARGFAMGGSKVLSGALDRFRITTVLGTDTFDAGVANISWEF